MDLQADIGVKSEEAVKETARAGKKIFAIAIKAEAEILKGAVNFATLIPKDILEGLCNKSEKIYRGKQSVKNLVGSGAKLENIEINKENARDFESTARKYGVDYSLKKDENGKVLVFFKAKDINVLTAAFKDFSARVTNKEHKKAITARVKGERTAEKAQKRQERQRSRDKKKERENVL